ncbi:MAG: FAD-dependent oxidoreductase [Anaerolineae bacterium]|jgi:2,4-dienoyl-CoA reductase-like NADH-dependent reductase (Old Yellow Enzyme family)/thioredoxin reductase
MQNETVQHIFQPITINGMTVRNRIVVPPMDTGFGSTEHAVTDQLIAYHRRRAEGGLGLIIVEYTSVDPGGRCVPTQLGIYDDSFIPGFQQLTRAVHEHGASIALQIHHGGVRARPEHSGGEIVAPSAIPDPGVGVVPRALTIPEIKDLVEAFGQAARRAKEAGFDAVEIHGAHGYLINQFLSPWFNRRDDAYGGTFEKRLRFALEVVQRVREYVGPDYPVGFRIIGEELPLGSGLTIRDTARIAARLEGAGIDMIHVSIGNVGPSLGMVVAPMAMDWGFNVYSAAAIKRVVSIPVIAVGRITDVHLAEQIVREGHADLVAMGRASLADPEFPQKALEGRFEEIRRCFGCADACTMPYRHCNNNPELGRELGWDLTVVSQPKKVWVVGGGVAGMEAALLAARRGHRVTLFEQETELGGQIHAAAAPPHKAELLNAISNRVPLLKKYGVDLRLQTGVTADLVRQEEPDVVILATGALPQRPPIPGIDRPEVVQAKDVLTGKAFVGPKVAVLGGGMVGAETAEYLADRRRDVTLIEMLDSIAGDMPRIPRPYLLHRLGQLGVHMITGAQAEAITDEGVLVNLGGQRQMLEGFSSIVLATGSKPTDELAAELKDVVQEIYIVGDARQVARISDATAQAAEAALAV